VIARVRALLARMPPLTGEPIELRYRVESASAHAGSFLRERRISLDPALRRSPEEFARIFTHELFHFVWVRIGNARRRSFGDLVARELRAGVPGELGWSAERRKLALRRRDAERRTRPWRLYCCESFCDTAAWLYSGVLEHEEFALPRGARAARREWFRKLQWGMRRFPV
jgi:hypothetical protein